METLLLDARYAARSLLRTPGFTGVALLTLPLGTGVSSAVCALETALRAE